MELQLTNQNKLTDDCTGRSYNTSSNKCCIAWYVAVSTLIIIIHRVYWELAFASGFAREVDIEILWEQNIGIDGVLFPHYNLLLRPRKVQVLSGKFHYRHKKYQMCYPRL